MEDAMRRSKAIGTPFAAMGALALVLSAVASAEASDADAARGATASRPSANKQIRIANLPAKTQRTLRRAGIVGPALTLAGVPNLIGSSLAGLSLYRSPWDNGGQCVSGVLGGVVDGADCDSALLT